MPWRLTWLRAVSGGVAVATVGLMLGAWFAGSAATLPDGIRIAGVDVGGMTPKNAEGVLERRSSALRDVPVTFTAGAHRWKLRPVQLGVKVDWRAAIATARREGEGFGFVRGYRRLRLRFFDADVVPPARAYDAALTYKIGQFAALIDQPHREAALVRKGLRFIAVPGQTGRILDRSAAAAVIVRGLAGFARTPVALPVRSDPPTVTVPDLRPAQDTARTIVSARVRLTLDGTSWRLPRWRLAEMLELPAAGRTQVRLGGPDADRYFARLAHVVDRPPRNADFAVTSAGIRIVPAKPGFLLDVTATTDAVMRAASIGGARVAELAVAEKQPSRTTRQAQAMGITGVVGSYETFYGGDPNRIHNVQLVAHLIDRALIAPGAEFSFNGTTGERTAAKGFLEAPVIINGELASGLAGGVCQVSTTVFNAAYEAGLSITARTNHALYISHYPLGRDATVNYPDTDLRFKNDTPHWLLLRTFVGSSSLTVNIYGTQQNRRVESETAPLVETAPPPVKKTDDPALPAGKAVVDDLGEPSRATSVHRRVYAPSGKLLYDTTWYSSYRAEPKLVRVGTKPKPEKPVTPKPGVPAEAPTPADRQPVPQP